MGILNAIKRFLDPPVTACLECGGPVAAGDQFCSEEHATDYMVERNP